MIILCIICLMNVSCKSHKCCSDALRAVQDSSALFSVARSVDTIYRHDSVYVWEVMRGDTVYLTRTEWRDRWRTRLVHDTVRHTEYVDRVMEKPPERYVPKFYKTSTILFYILLLLIAVFVFIKLRLRWLFKPLSSWDASGFFCKPPPLSPFAFNL